MTTPHDPQTDSDQEPGKSKAEDYPPASEGSPENLPPKAWTTMILFAAFIVLTSGCMINLLFR